MSIRNLQRRRQMPAAALLALTALAVLLLSALIVTGCGYTKILRNRLPQPHRVDDFEFAVLFQYEAPQARHVNLCGNWSDKHLVRHRGQRSFRP